MTTYPWDSASEWFNDFIDKQEPEQVLAIAKQLALKLGGDEIQDLYQSDMIADGYFLQELEKFSEQLKEQIKTLPAYLEFAAENENIDLEEWLDDHYGETIENLREEHETVSKAIAYLKQEQS